MKKKIFSICLAFALLVPAVFMLTACGEPDKYYYTITTPENCTFYVNSVVIDKDNKPLVNKGDEFDGQVNITPGYEVSGELVIKVNGKVVDWTDTGENDYYYFSFIPTEDFNIVIEGTIIESLYEVKFIEGEYADVSNLYIRFEGENEQLLSDFLRSANKVQHFKYNDNLKFYVYTKGYSVEPSFFRGYAFYKDEAKNEYGYVYDDAVVESFDIEFYGTIPVNISFVKDASGNNLIGGSVDTEQLKMSVNENNLIITFGSNISQETISQLTLTINGEVKQNLSLVAGENVISLKRAYKYVSTDGLEYSPYHYTINLNFYDFDEFSGIFDEQMA